MNPESASHVFSEEKQQTTQSSIKLCINCANPVNTKFCGHCGQPSQVERITFKTLAEDVYDRLFALDNKFARTIMTLFQRPGYLVNEVLKGNRVMFFGSAGMYFLLLSIYLILFQILDISMEEFTNASREMFTPADMSEKQVAANKRIMGFINNNFRFFGFLFVPFYTMGLMIFFRKAKRNFFEHAVVVFYTQALSMLFTIIMLFAYKINGFQSTTLMMVLGLLTFGYIVSGSYSGNKIWVFLKAILAYFLGFIFIMIASMVAGIVLYVFFPEIFRV